MYNHFHTLLNCQCSGISQHFSSLCFEYLSKVVKAPIRSGQSVRRGVEGVGGGGGGGDGSSRENSFLQRRGLCVGLTLLNLQSPQTNTV